MLQYKTMITLTNLQKVLDQTTVIDIPALEVEAGEVAALVGPVDSGKEILFQLVCGRIQPTTGSVRLAGLDPYRAQREFSRQVGVLFAENTLYRRMSVLGNLQFYCHLHHLPKARPLEVVEQVGLADQTRTMVEELSPGLSRRLALGRMLLTNPKVLLLADPFAGCEQVSMELISQAIRRQVDAGVGIVFHPGSKRFRKAVRYGSSPGSRPDR